MNHIKLSSTQDVEALNSLLHSTDSPELAEACREILLSNMDLLRLSVLERMAKQAKAIADQREGFRTALREFLAGSEGQL
jgi:hypothetical protein